jgi:hypothetical protein
MCFRVGTEDAEFLEKQFAPVFTKVDLVNIPNYNLYLKLLIDGYVSDPFNIRTLPPKPVDFSLVEKIKELSALKYGKPLEEIEAEIQERYRHVRSIF